MGRPLTMSLLAGVVLAAVAAVPGASSGSGLPRVVDYTIPARHDTEPIVLDGQDFGTWSVPANLTARLPLDDLKDCPYSVDPSGFDPTSGGLSGILGAFKQNCPAGYDPHSHYADPEIDTSRQTGDAVQGTPVNRLLGYRWNPHAGKYVQIPFQVDEVFTRYLNNEASGFAVYSGEDQHTTYAFDREGFRYTKDGPPDDPCRAQPASPPATDPVKGLDANDEVAFMASDAGPRAPASAPLPSGIEGAKTVTIADPTNPRAAPTYVYVMKAAANGPRPAFNASNGYVHYARDANADEFAYSQSSYGDYGNAPKGIYCDPATGAVVRNPDGTPKIGQRRPLDTATVTTSRYRFRYDGRWLLTGIRISPDGGQTYGPDLIDRWKARAFAQDPGSNTPCCGYEEEQTNWGGSSILLGERVGPVRAIRETWGADSGTNVVRRETFYRNEMVQKTWLRVHPIPPLDGIYAQWDFNAGRMTRFYNPVKLGGVRIDGSNDEVYGNFDNPCNPAYDSNDTSKLDQTYRTLYREIGLCEPHLANEESASVDQPDLTFSNPNAGVDWSETAGPWGTIVDRVSTEVKDLTPGGAAQSVLAAPYYRDDSCFDDGTGTDPGPKLHLRSGDEPKLAADGTPRRCWHPTDGLPDGSDHFFQGSIGTHGIHILFTVESDNARLTVPVDEVVSDWRLVMLPGQRGATAGEQYGRGLEKPLVAVVSG